MANVVHRDLFASTIETINLTAPIGGSVTVFNIYEPDIVKQFQGNFFTVRVMNVDGADVVYFTTDGSDPVIEGDDNHAVPAVAGHVTLVPVAGKEATVKLISAGTPKIEAEGR